MALLTMSPVVNDSGSGGTVGTFNKPSYLGRKVGPATFHQDSWEEQGKVRREKPGDLCASLCITTRSLDRHKEVFKSPFSPVQWVSHSPPCLFMAAVGILGYVANTQLDGEKRNSLQNLLLTCLSHCLS